MVGLELGRAFWHGHEKSLTPEPAMPDSFKRAVIGLALIAAAAITPWTGPAEAQLARNNIIIIEHDGGPGAIQRGYGIIEDVTATIKRELNARFGVYDITAFSNVFQLPNFKRQGYDILPAEIHQLTSTIKTPPIDMLLTYKIVMVFPPAAAPPGPAPGMRPMPPAVQPLPVLRLSATLIRTPSGEMVAPIQLPDMTMRNLTPQCLRDMRCLTAMLKAAAEPMGIALANEIADRLASN